MDAFEDAGRTSASAEVRWAVLQADPRVHTTTAYGADVVVRRPRTTVEHRPSQALRALNVLF